MTTPAPSLTCPNCSENEMKRFACDSFYDYFRCDSRECGKERLVFRDDRPAFQMNKDTQVLKGDEKKCRRSHGLIPLINESV